MIRKFVKYSLLIAIAFIQIFPFFWMLSFSLKNNQEIFGGNVMGLPQTMNWDNYVNAMRTGNVLNYLANSIIISTGSICLTLLLSLMLAYAIVRLDWRFRKGLLIYILLGLMIPVHAIVLPVFIVIHKIGLYNTHLSLILVNAAVNMPTAVPIISAYMRTLPKELEESAALDGANVYKIFSSIILPIIKPVIVVVIILSFIYIWNEFMMGAGMVIASFPTIIIYLALNKKIQESFIMGSVKG